MKMFLIFPIIVVLSCGSMKNFLSKPLGDSTATDEPEGFLFMRKSRPLSKEKLINRIFWHQVYASKTRKHDPPAYSRLDLQEFLLSNTTFQEIYSNWRESGFKTDLTPSIDRLNDYKGYSFQNIQIITWAENRSKAHRDIRNGVNNKINRPIQLYLTNGTFLKAYHSLSSCQRETGVHSSKISKICSDAYGRNSYNGFVFKYRFDNNFDLDEKSLTFIEWDKKKKEGKGPVVIQFSMEGKRIRSYKTASEACRRTGIQSSNIKKACRGEIRKSGGFIWKYRDDQN